MKVVAIAKPKKEMLMSLPPDKQQELIKITKEVNKKWKDEKKVIASYISPTSGYTFAILDYDSAEEWMKDLMSNPLFNYYDQEIHPVVDYDSAMKIYGF